MISSNYHTHTIYCDGKDTPREMVEEALRLGCPELGFSGHAYAQCDTDCCMSPEGTLQYQQEIRALQEEYKGKIRILMGIEQEYYSEAPTDMYDYVIGSVHYVYKDGEYFPVDAGKDLQMQIVREHFGGDYYALAEAYYANVADVYRKTRCDIIGHFDLITKYNEGNCLFDIRHPRYIAAADQALDALLPAPVTFEINTGAIARGLRTVPYPDERILRRILAAGKPLLWNSDCHDKTKLLLGLPGNGNLFRKG